MFIHLGGDTVVPLKEIISIMDMKSTCCSAISKEFMNVAEEEGFIKCISGDEAKSFILSERDNQIIIYLSPISSTTLQKRANFIKDVSANTKWRF